MVALMVLAGVLVVAGASGVFGARRAAGRLTSLGVLAVGGVVATFAAAPDRSAALTVTVVSAATLAGLVAVATRLERVARHLSDDELDLRRDPLRCG